jgi:hypothetical protein
MKIGLDSKRITLIPNLIKTSLLFEELIKWQVEWDMMSDFLTLSVEHGAGVKGSKAATNSTTRGCLGTTATSVWWHCVQCHVSWYLAWGHRVCWPHRITCCWPTSQRCSVWRTADTMNRMKQAVSIFHEMWPLPQHRPQIYEIKELRKIYEPARDKVIGSAECNIIYRSNFVSTQLVWVVWKETGRRKWKSRHNFELWNLMKSKVQGDEDKVKICSFQDKG